MTTFSYRIVVIGGWCGNRLFVVADHLRDLLTEAGFKVRVTPHNIWENYTQPPHSHLVLQLLPAFTEAEVGRPVINIRPLLKDLDDPETLDKVMAQVQADHAAQTEFL
jgi:hypothetical protein